MGGGRLFDRVASGVAIAVRSCIAPLAVSFRLANRWDVESSGEIPAKRWGVALAGKAALDEVFFALEFATAPLAGLDELPRIAREVADATELFRQRGWFESPERYHQMPTRPSSVAIVSARSLLGDYQHLSFERATSPMSASPDVSAGSPTVRTTPLTPGCSNTRARRVRGWSVFRATEWETRSSTSRGFALAGFTRR